MISKLANKDTLDFLGANAQYLIVKSLVENKTLFTQVQSYLNPAVFTEEPLGDIIKLIKSEYDQRGTIMSWKDIEYRLKEKIRTEDEMSKFKNAIIKLKAESPEGQATATEVGINHLKTLEMKRVLKNCLETLKDGGYTDDKAARVVEQVEAIDRVSTNEDELSPENLFDLVVNTAGLKRVPTGFRDLDKHMNGGLPKGNLGLVIAGTGVGKTTFGSSLVVNSALKGSKVIHIFFEDTIAEIGRKYYSTLTARWTNDYETTDKAEHEVLRKEIMGNEEYRAALARITPKRMRNGEDRVEDVINFVRHKISMGQKPDMIVIDYMSCFKLTSDKRDAVNKEYELLEKAMKKLECFAQDEEIAIWVEQQTNRDGSKAETKNDRLGNIQGSFRMTQPAAFAFYLERSSDDMNRANMYMDKCRGCQPTVWANMLFNNGNCQIDFDDILGKPSTNSDNALAWANERFETILENENNR